MFEVPIGAPPPGGISAGGIFRSTPGVAPDVLGCYMHIESFAITDPIWSCAEAGFAFFAQFESTQGVASLPIPNLAPDFVSGPGAIPEPSTMMLLAGGLALGALRYRSGRGPVRTRDWRQRMNFHFRNSSGISRADSRAPVVMLSTAARPWWHGAPPPR